MREARALSDELAPKGLAIRVIDVGDGRALCYLYRPCQLCRMLACEKEAAFLTEQGYPYLTVEDAVDLLLRAPFAGRRVSTRNRPVSGLSDRRCRRVHRQQRAQLLLLRLLEMLYRRMRRAESV